MLTCSDLENEARIIVFCVRLLQLELFVQNVELEVLSIDTKLEKKLF